MAHKDTDRSASRDPVGSGNEYRNDWYYRTGYQAYNPLPSSPPYWFGPAVQPRMRIDHAIESQPNPAKSERDEGTDSGSDIEMVSPFLAGLCQGTNYM